MESSLQPPAAVRAALERFRALLTQRFGRRLKELVLFGSHARGRAHEESGLTERERGEVFELAYEADAAAEGPDDWVGLSALAYSEEQAADMRSRQRLLFSNIDGEGLHV
jgi:predicted nucleotidyltransferase